MTNLEAGEELIGVLVLAHVERLTIVVLEGAPEAGRPVEVAVTQRQVRKHPLRAKIDTELPQRRMV